jgi:hypothetical protein
LLGYISSRKKWRSGLAALDCAALAKMKKDQKGILEEKLAIREALPVGPTVSTGEEGTT